jgi:hypothetical protein
MINGYPKSALFFFENFTQFEQKEDLIDLLKRQSFATDTNITIKPTKKPTPSNNTFKIMCQHASPMVYQKSTKISNKIFRMEKLKPCLLLLNHSTQQSQYICTVDHLH